MFNLFSSDNHDNQEQLDLFSLSKRMKMEWLGKSVHRWMKQALEKAYIPDINWIASKKSVAARKDQTLDMYNPRKCRHSWMASTLGIVWLMAHWVVHIHQEAVKSAAELFQCVMLHFFSTTICNFVLDVNMRRLVASSLPAAYHEGGVYRSVSITRGLLDVEEINAFIPKGCELTKADHARI